MSSPIEERIKKLLNMTVANGCSEDEAETAMKMAAAAAARAGLDFEALRTKKGEAPTKRKAKSKYMSEEFKPHQALAAMAAATLYGIECNVWNLGAKGMMFVGREELIEAAEHTMFWLFRQIEELYKQALPKGMTQRERSEFRKTFKAACAHRINERANKVMRELKTNEQAAQSATGLNALVIAGHFEQIEREVDEYWHERSSKSKQAHNDWLARLSPEARAEEEARAAKEAKKVKKQRKGRSIPTGIGTQAGLAAGDRAQLRKEVK